MSRRAGRKELRGYLTNRYNVLLGGVSLKQTRRVPVPCLEDADFVPPETQYVCYSSHYGGETGVWALCTLRVLRAVCWQLMKKAVGSIGIQIRESSLLLLALSPLLLLALLLLALLVTYGGMAA